MFDDIKAVFAVVTVILAISILLLSISMSYSIAQRGFCVFKIEREISSASQTWDIALQVGPYKIPLLPGKKE